MYLILLLCILLRIAVEWRIILIYQLVINIHFLNVLKLIEINNERNVYYYIYIIKYMLYLPNVYFWFLRKPHSDFRKNIVFEQQNWQIVYVCHMLFLLEICTVEYNYGRHWFIKVQNNKYCYTYYAVGINNT